MGHGFDHRPIHENVSSVNQAVPLYVKDRTNVSRSVAGMAVAAARLRSALIAESARPINGQQNISTALPEQLSLLPPCRTHYVLFD